MTPTETHLEPDHATEVRLRPVVLLLVQTIPFGDVKMAPDAPTATKRPPFQAIPIRSYPAPDDLGVQVIPSGEVRRSLLDPDPTATKRLSVRATDEKDTLELNRLVQFMPSGEV